MKLHKVLLLTGGILLLSMSSVFAQDVDLKINVDGKRVAMDVFPQQAGASASAGSVLIFIIGGLLSALINLASGSHLAWTLAACLMLSGALGLALNAQLRRGLARTGQAGA